MKEPTFDSTPEFEHFREIMRGVLSVPKKRLDELVAEARNSSDRKGNRRAPGRKKASAIRIRKRQEGSSTMAQVRKGLS
jgi:hypothetical protein